MIPAFRRTSVHRVGVVIPARDESDLILGCLDAVHRSIHAVAGRVDVDVVVVADACSDDTADRARASGAIVLETAMGNVGAARAAGSEGVLDRGVDWLAHTDADSIVPVEWIARQLDLAERGADVVVGTVRPDFAGLTPQQRALWCSTHRDGQALGHVHGANLGIRATAYRAVGGFHALREHEDNDVVDRLRLVARVVASGELEVVTSSRRIGRTPGGYAAHLASTLGPAPALSD